MSAAIGAFLVGLALSGPVQERAGALIGPLRDLFAAVFFLFFSFQIDPATSSACSLPAAVLAVVAVGEQAGRRLGGRRPGRRRAARPGPSRHRADRPRRVLDRHRRLGAGLADGAELGALAAAYVLLTAIAGPGATKYAAHLPYRPGSGAPKICVRPAPLSGCERTQILEDPLARRR